MDPDMLNSDWIDDILAEDCPEDDITFDDESPSFDDFPSGDYS